MESNTTLKTLPLYAVPATAQLDAWNSLTRDEQVASYRKAIDEADKSGASPYTAEEIEAQVLKRHRAKTNETN